MRRGFMGGETMAFHPPGEDEVVGIGHQLLVHVVDVHHVGDAELLPQPLQLIAQGLTNREIGERLFLSLNTVKAHTRNIYGKLDIHNRTQAVSRARALGILPPT